MKSSTYYSILFTQLLIVSSCTTKTNSNNKISAKQKDNFEVLLHSDTLHISSNSSQHYN
ncbi:MAG: hypothetical protein ACI8ZM_005777, partial [Crocinitomix sp.]